MKRTISAIPQLYRNVRRWAEIISVLSRYGLADWLSRINLDMIKEWLRASEGEPIANQSNAVRIRMALAELGPTFIKFGQVLSTRPDIVGPEIADELSNLQSNTPADDFEVVKDIIEEQQGCSIDDLFSEFQRSPMASASIGQVHFARLKQSSTC